MAKIRAELTEGCEYAATDEQMTTLTQFVESFRTRDYEAFRSAHIPWVKRQNSSGRTLHGFPS
jgi:hypothetical protein